MPACPPKRGLRSGAALATLLLTAPCAWAETSAGPPQAGPPPPQREYVVGRSRLYLRLDPAASHDPDGRAEPGALGTFSVLARGETEIEASGWLAHAPGAASYAEDSLSGDVRTLRASRRFGPLLVTGGRQWTMVASQRIGLVDGLTATYDLTRWADLSFRGGLSAPRPGELLGDGYEIGGGATVRPWEPLVLSLGALHERREDTPARSRWTGTADYFASPRLIARAAATADVTERALVEGRLEVSAQTTEALWTRLYARRTLPSLLLQADELLAVFAQDDRQEVGATGEYTLPRLTSVRLRGDLAIIRSLDRDAAGRYRLGADFTPTAGTTATCEATVRLDRLGRSVTGRLAGRMPLRGTIFGTAELLGDSQEDRLAATVSRSMAARLGAGFEPAEGWLAYGSAEAGSSERWPSRLGGMVLVEYAFGAPVGYGGSP